MESFVPRTAIATYRLQLGASLPFDRVCELLPYLRGLGISHLYLSPCLKAAAGSTHGYDVVDPADVDPVLGGREAFEHLCREAAAAGMGLMLDIVPNHMAAAGRQNRWWWEVLSEGRHSRHAGFFDIRWDHPDPRLRGKVLLPVLGDELEHCLEAGQILVRRRAAEICLSYFEHEFPLSARALLQLLQTAAEASKNPSLGGLAATLAAGNTRGGSGSSRPQPPVERILAALHGLDDKAAAALDDAIAAVNAEPARLQRLLDLQHYRLAFWRRANRELNYRRFFDIHHLAGVGVEREEVFAATHALVLSWVAQGRIEGLRIDHPDGLRDPTGYLERLRAEAPRSWIVVEKILEPGEELPAEWPVAGTTGYDFLNRVGGLFIDPAGERPLTDFYAEFTGQEADFREVVHAKKLWVLENLFASELSRLEELLEESRGRKPGGDELRRQEARRALAETVACLPVYRTYIRPDSGRVGDRDQAVVRQALAAAMERQTAIEPGLWRLLEDLLLLRKSGRAAIEFVRRFQQLTGPVMAKGVEDTAFYCFNRLVSLNEVGGDPGAFGTTPQSFNDFCGRIQSRWPQSLLASATHDTKRGEDTRLRISLLSEMPQRWAAAVRRWARMNAPFRTRGLPDANAEYLLYQTLVGAWPIGAERLTAYMRKAAKEAKTHTSWTDPDPGYEKALQDFVERVLGHADFIADLEAFLAPMRRPALIASLSQTLIKCTAPGVPDIYQGTELPDLSLVDPDNRRPVDFGQRRRLLAELDRMPAGEALARQAEGLTKLFVLKRALAARREAAEAFGPGSSYRPLTTKGGRAAHLVAFARGGRVLTLAPRLVWGLAGDWGDTAVELPPGEWLNQFTGGRWSGGWRETAQLLSRFPAALLVRAGGRG